MSSVLDTIPSRTFDTPSGAGKREPTCDLNRADPPARRDAPPFDATTPQIEQAKGALMVVHGLTEEAAYALLRWYSQGSVVKLRAIADGLTSQPEPEPLGDEASRKLTDLLNTIAGTGGP